MTATKIYEAIKARHSGPGWTLIAEAPTTTGHDRRAGWIDAYAIGMWSSNRGFVAYEIKISRGDFLRDVGHFADQALRRVAAKLGIAIYGQSSEALARDITEE